MEITNVKTLIEAKLACIDIENKTNKERDLDSRNHFSLLRHELQGIKQVLQVMGIRLEIETNPYYYENGKPSTYKISLEG
jgi:hypothetical protein